VTLTSDGGDLHLRCRHIADKIEALRDESVGARSEVSGTLHINAPVVIGHQWVVPALAELRQHHSKLALEVELLDHYVAIISDGLDAVVRIGEQSLVVCGAPDYLARRGAPRNPADLGGYTCLLFRITSIGLIRTWQVQDGRETRELRPESSVVMDKGEVMLACAVAGMGIVQIPDYIAAGAVDAGCLVEVLAHHRAPPMPISVLYPFARRVTPWLRALIEVLAEHAGQS